MFNPFSQSSPEPNNSIAPTYLKLFLGALTDPHSYNPLSNGFIWFGVLWGIPVPVVTIWFHYTLGHVRFPNLFLNQPVQVFFLLHPVLFGLLFGLMGSMVDHYIERLKEESITDSLTGLYNHGYFRRELERRINEAERYDLSFCLLMYDIDHFKDVNDKYGHQAGDDVLQELGELLVNSTRDPDIVSRYGGEEFAIICPETTVDESLQLAERIRSQVEKHDFGLVEGITISGGIAQYPDNGQSDTELIKVADNKLYEAKNSGRNQIKPDPT